MKKAILSYGEGDLENGHRNQPFYSCPRFCGKCIGIELLLLTSCGVPMQLCMEDKKPTILRWFIIFNPSFLTVQPFMYKYNKSKRAARKVGSWQSLGFQRTEKMEQQLLHQSTRSLFTHNTLRFTVRRSAKISSLVIQSAMRNMDNMEDAETSEGKEKSTSDSILLRASRL